MRVVTPGTVAEPGMLPAKENSYLAALCPGPAGYGLAYVDVTTGEFAVSEFADADPALCRVAVENDLLRIGPRECLVPKQESPDDPAPFPHGTPQHPGHTTPYDARYFGLETATDALRSHFGVVSLEAFGCAQSPLAIRAAGAILAYLGETNAMLLPLLTGLRTYQTDGTMHLDAATRRNLELHWTGRTQTAAHSLLGTLDGTKTAMGGRLLRRMLAQPLTDRAAIEERLDTVEAFVTRTTLRMQTLALLAGIGDMERLTARARQEAATPRELLALRDALHAVPTLVTLLHGADIARPRRARRPPRPLHAGRGPHHPRRPRAGGQGADAPHPARLRRAISIISSTPPRTRRRRSRRWRRRSASAPASAR